MCELEVDFVLHKCLELFDARQSILGQLSMPLFINFKRCIRFLYSKPFLEVVYLSLEARHAVVDIRTKLALTSFHPVNRVLDFLL